MDEPGPSERKGEGDAGVLPISAAKCERGFLAQNRIKTQTKRASYNIKN